MLWKKSLVVLMTGVFVITGQACLEVNEEEDTGTNTVSPATTSTIHSTGAPISTLTMPTTSIPEPMPTLTEPPLATDPPATPSPAPTKTLTQCEKDELAVQAALDAYFFDFEKWPTEDGLPGEIAWEEIVPTYMDEMPYANNKCEWKVNSKPEGFACMGRRC